ncbi:hypothetical protein F8568_030090 [Actinomadura sp. LD22]|uniref:Uncharacterized protein n=1 Tax=Actinomadura physcomitrii TaxID=2650748 RepID=A0A6I4MKR5_9ACTN|nr:hypothetical protein [Actinomadura physcomitrii]MWA04557.1 hypothetical protein [Actinomadura physcomitrii]
MLTGTRTRRRSETAVRHLEALAVALEPDGWRFVRLYRREEFPLPVPLLWVYVRDVGLAVRARAVRGGGWVYGEAQRGRGEVLAPCSDVDAAAEAVAGRLKRRMFPGTW